MADGNLLEGVVVAGSQWSFLQLNYLGYQMRDTFPFSTEGAILTRRRTVNPAGGRIWMTVRTAVSRRHYLPKGHFEKMGIEWGCNLDSGWATTRGVPNSYSVVLIS